MVVSVNSITEKNPFVNHPSLNLQKIVLDICEPRQYYGKEAHLRLNKIAEAVHRNVLHVCADYSKTDLLIRLYDLFDLACYYIREGSYWWVENVDIVRAVEKAPAIYRYLLEAALYSCENSEKREPNMDLTSVLAKMGDLFLHICYYSDYLFYSGFMGGFTVSAEGDISFIISKKLEDILKTMYKELGVRRRSFELEEFQKKFYEDFGASFEELAAPYDKPFKTTYGVKLSSLAKVMEYTAMKIAKIRTGSVKISYIELIKKLRKGLAYDKRILRRSLRLFEIDSGLLSDDWQYYKLYHVPMSVSRRPLMHLSGKVGRKGVLIFGPNALIRALALQLGDVQRGVTELKMPTELSSEERGRTFERKVRDELLQHNFKVLRITDSPPVIGEIDAVAVHEDKGILLVIEAKSPKMDLSTRKIKWQLKTAQKWCEKLHKKVQWVRENLELIAKRLKFDKLKTHDIIGIVVTEVPWYHGQALRYDVATIEQFRLWLLTLE